MTPTLSVLLPVYNGEKYIREAVQSVLDQTFKDFELIIIDDGSSDQTSFILSAFLDPRIIRLKNEKNIGLAASLNRGLEKVRGMFVARMDADDVSLPERFERQINFLRDHPNVGVVGTDMVQTDHRGREIAIVERFCGHEQILQEMLLCSAMNDPTVIMRADLLQKVGGYDPAVLYASDTELWSRLIRQTRFANLSDVLYRRRLHKASIMSTRFRMQEREATQARKRLQMQVLGYEIPEDDRLSTRCRRILAHIVRQIIPAPRRYQLRHSKLGKYLTRDAQDYYFFAIEQMKKILSAPFILKDYFLFYRKMRQANDCRFSARLRDLHPCLFEKTKTTSFDRHYVYHPAWAARCLAKLQPKEHIDISSTLHFCSMVSAFLPVRFYDYRPAPLILDNLETGHADLLSLPFKDESVASLSCMHVIEHIGLGRYGDPVDPQADLKAIKELKRVLAKGGSLLFVVPVGRPKVHFNAHRIYSYEQVMSYFSDLELKEFALVSMREKDKGLIYNQKELVADERIGCGCFWFVK